MPGKQDIARLRKAGASWSEVAERFSVEDPQTGCWLWSRSRDTSGYALVWDGTKMVLVHRMVLQESGRNIVGKVALHSCDRGKDGCVSPAHLEAGTVWGNNQDARIRGRNPRYKGLTMADGIEIRRRYAAGGITQRALGLEYGVSHSAISQIVTGLYLKPMKIKRSTPAEVARRLVAQAEAEWEQNDPNLLDNDA